MKILLMSMNSKYIHSNLAIQYLYRYAEQNRALYSPHIELDKKEYTINMSIDDILIDLQSGGYDYIFVSTYIWNIEPLQYLFSNLRQINHNIKIFFGGPEVTYNPVEQLEAHVFLDGVIVGEGEETFLQCLVQLAGGVQTLKEVPGVVCREGDAIVSAPKRPPMLNLDAIPFPYEDLSAYDHRILYYETTRGCPYSCSYCLSSALRGVRYFSHEKVFKDLDVFLNARVPQVKFVDRTFNVSKTHAIPILEYLIENDNGVTNFHFEITADRLDDAYFDVIQKARKGLFQFEIGVQTTCSDALDAINRPVQFDRLKANTRRLIELKNAHTHVDLIAGLPYEGFERFLQSFDDVFAIGADHVQLGFLKLLKGTPLDATREMHGYKVRVQSPYEVLCNRYISFEEMSALKRIETLLEAYHNSDKFTHTLRYTMAQTQWSPSRFYVELSNFWNAHRWFDAPVAAFGLYERLYAFCHAINLPAEVCSDLLKVDYYSSKFKGMKPLFYYEDDPKFNAKRLKFLSDSAHVARYLPQYREVRPKEILKAVEFISVRYDIIKLIESHYAVAEAKSAVLIIDPSSDAPLTQLEREVWEDKHG